MRYFDYENIEKRPNSRKKLFYPKQSCFKILSSLKGAKERVSDLTLIKALVHNVTLNVSRVNPQIEILRVDRKRKKVFGANFIAKFSGYPSTFSFNNFNLLFDDFLLSSSSNVNSLYPLNLKHNNKVIFLKAQLHGARDILVLRSTYSARNLNSTITNNEIFTVEE